MAPQNPFAREDPAAIIQRSRDELAEKTRIHTKHWGLGGSERWDADLEQGLIWFTFPDGRIVSAPVQVIGSYNTEDSTWLWAWDNPSVEEPLAQAARLARDFGARHGLEQFTQPEVQCSEDDAWTFTALAVSVSELLGRLSRSVGSAPRLHGLRRDHPPPRELTGTPTSPASQGR